MEEVAQKSKPEERPEKEMSDDLFGDLPGGNAQQQQQQQQQQRDEPRPRRRRQREGNGDDGDGSDANGDEGRVRQKRPRNNPRNEEEEDGDLDEDGIRAAVRDAIGEWEGPMRRMRQQMLESMPLPSSESAAHAAAAAANGDGDSDDSGSQAVEDNRPDEAILAAMGRAAGNGEGANDMVPGGVGPGLGDSLANNRSFPGDEWMFERKLPSASRPGEGDGDGGGDDDDDDEGDGEEDEDGLRKCHYPDGYCYLCHTTNPEMHKDKYRNKVIELLSYYYCMEIRTVCGMVKKYYDMQIRPYNRGRKWTEYCIWRHMSHHARTKQFELWSQIRTLGQMADMAREKLSGDINPALIKCVLSIFTQTRAAIALIEGRGARRTAGTGLVPSSGGSAAR